MADSKTDLIVIDTETTGLDEDDEIVEIAICALDRQPLFETLIKPNKSGSEEAFNVDGIGADLLADAPAHKISDDDYLSARLRQR